MKNKIEKYRGLKVYKDCDTISETENHITDRRDTNG